MKDKILLNKENLFDIMLSLNESSLLVVFSVNNK